MRIAILDDSRFDALTKSLATTIGRRNLLKGAVGLGAAATTARVHSQAVDAARRPTPTPKPSTPTCPGLQTRQNGQCTCPANTTNCGPDCCPAGAQCCNNACCYGICYDDGSCCAPICTAGTCGPDSCGGTCPCTPDKVCSGGSCVCPAGTKVCADGICRQCCEFSNQSAECAATQGGDASCWACSAAAPGSSDRVCGLWSGGCVPAGGGPGGRCDPVDHICYPA